MSLFPLGFYLSRLVSHGEVRVTGTDGEPQSFGKPGAKPFIALRLIDPLFPWRLMLNPSLAVGEAYMNGGFVIEEGTLRDFPEIAILSQSKYAAAHRRPWARRLARLLHAKDMWNDPRQAAKNVRHHYDIDHALYESFLDKDMQYSCAYWSEETMSLEEAQLAKKRHIARKLRLSPGMEVLDIGSGWGGLALHLAREHGVKVTGVTLSKDQFETANRRAQEAGLQERVELQLIDYRSLGGRFDRIVSVGMFEHVGQPNFRQFFAKLSALLAPDGIALLHTIAKRGDPGPPNDWIARYIFPGGYLPTLSELSPAIEEEGLWLGDLEVLRLHYAKTLHAWDQRFQAHRREIAARFDERFCRMWEFYLQASEASFRFDDCCVFQLQLANQVDAVPITRDYLHFPSSLDEQGHRQAAE